MPQDELQQRVSKLIDSGASDEDIQFFIQNFKPEAPPKDEHSVTGFGGNLLSSGGKFIGDTAKGLASIPSYLIKMATTDPVAGGQEIIDAVKGAPSAIANYAKGRYGSLGQAGETLYHDPVGVAGDVSTVAGIGASTKIPKIAGTLGKIEAATNPLNAIAKPIAGRLRKAGPVFQEAAISSNERMLKMNKGTLEGMPKFGKTLPERSRNVSKALLEDPNGQISKRGANNFDAATQNLQTKVDELVAENPEARGSTEHLQRTLDEGRGTFEDQWAPQADTSAYDAVAKQVLDNPKISKHKRTTIDRSLEHELGMAPEPSEVKVVGREPIKRVRAETARGLTQGTYRNLGDKAYGELKGPQTQAHKAAARGGRAILNEAIPKVEPINDTIGQRIDLGQILDEAVFRSGKHDPIGLTQQIVLSGNAPYLLPASLLNRPGVGSSIARGLFQSGGKMAQAKVPADLLRAALIARLSGGSQE